MGVTFSSNGRNILHLGRNILHLGCNILHLGRNILHLGRNILHLGRNILLSNTLVVRFFITFAEIRILST